MRPWWTATSPCTSGVWCRFSSREALPARAGGLRWARLRIASGSPQVPLSERRDASPRCHLPPPLWADPSAREPERAWLEEPTSPQPRPHAPQTPEPPQRGSTRARRWVIAGFAVLALLVAGLTGALLAGGDDSGSSATRAAATLPAATGGSHAADARRLDLRGRRQPASCRSAPTKASGTGFVIEDDGTIVTNAHVVDGRDVRQGRLQRLRQGRPARRSSAATSRRDLAVLKVDPSAAPQLRPLALADSDTVKVGDSAIAIGYPLGLDRTVDRRHRQRPRPRDQGAERLQHRQGHPDRRADQPRQLGRPAARRQGPRDRRQLADRDRRRRRGQRRHRLRDPVEHRARDRAAARGRARPSPTRSSACRRRCRRPAPGALVRKITPGSPAAKAGLHAGTTATGRTAT